jgi:hypothetical protein
MRITRTTDVQSSPVSSDWVTGTAFMEPIAAPVAPSRLSAAAMIWPGPGGQAPQACAW